MDCPKYTNKLFVASNDQGKELTVNFFQEYPVFEENEGQLITSAQSAHVCSIAMSRDLAEQLHNILGKHLTKGEGNG